MTNKKILITGGFGYLGNSLSRYFFDKGYDVRVFAHNKSPYRNKHFEKYEIFFGDILKKNTLKRACKDVDFVLHLAGLDYQECKENPMMALQVNGLGTRNLLECARNSNVKRFVYASTFHVYGKPKGKINEETLPAPLSDYAKTKLAGENYCRQFDSKMKCVILRISNVYGTPMENHESALVVNDLCRQCVENQKIILKTDGSQKRDFVAINDLGNAISIILTAAPQKLKESVFNVGGNSLLSIRQLAELISKTYFELYRKKVKIELGKSDSSKPEPDFAFDISRIRKLGYIPKADMKKEIVRTFKSFKGGFVG